MKTYIATSLGNAAQAKALADALREAGIAVTYPWWEHGGVWDAKEGQGDSVEHSQWRCVDAAISERDGVRDADFVIVILCDTEAFTRTARVMKPVPQHGTHTELGMAIALGKPVLLFASSASRFETNDTCAFYFAPGVERHVLYADDADRVDAMRREVLAMKERVEYAAFFRGEMQCESHPGISWPHDECPGPGMPWPAKQDFDFVLQATESDAVRRVSEALVKGAEFDAHLSAMTGRLPGTGTFTVSTKLDMDWLNQPIHDQTFLNKPFPLNPASMDNIQKLVADYEKRASSEARWYGPRRCEAPDGEVYWTAAFPLAEGGCGQVFGSTPEQCVEKAYALLRERSVSAEPQAELGIDKPPVRYSQNSDGKETIDRMFDIVEQVYYESIGIHEKGQPFEPSDDDDGVRSALCTALCAAIALKYEDRAGKKGDPEGDAKKAKFYRQMQRRWEQNDPSLDPRVYRKKEG